MTNTEKRYCRCGCGAEIISPRSFFKKGHYNRGRPSFRKGISLIEEVGEERAERIKLLRKGLITKPELPRQLCACGCGNLTKSGNTHVFGHSTKNRHVNAGENNGMYGKCGAQDPWYGHHLTEKQRIALSERNKKLRLDPNSVYNSEGFRKSLSVGIKAAVLSGRHNPQINGNRGARVLFTLNGTTTMLRSVPEFVVAYYFYLRGWVGFKYEAIRVHYDNHVFISDFSFGNTVYEVKDKWNSKCERIRDAFSASGYRIRIVEGKNLAKIRNYIGSVGIDINALVSEILLCRKKGEVYAFSCR